MIRLRRRPRTPAVLRNGARSRRAKLAARIAAGETALDFDGAVYAHPDVKQTLAAWQHEKCAFCEARCTHVTGHVEHFRPKGAWDQDDGNGLIRPGYWWLAYEWQNLVLACEVCNSRQKRNLFPLRHPARRATGPGGSLAREGAVFVDPSAEDPGRFIGFHAELPVGLDAGKRGEDTIRALGLDREKLSDRRRERLAELKAFADVVRLYTAGDLRPGPQADRVVAVCRERLAAIADGTGEYASMGRANLDRSILDEAVRATQQQ